MKNTIHKFLFGDPIGEPIDLSPGLKIKSTIKPEEKISYNEVFRNINRELHSNKLTHVNRRVDR